MLHISFVVVLCLHKRCPVTSAICHVYVARLAQETGSEQLCDLHIFADARKVVESLKQHDCGAALAWCADNRARLKKIKSSLEFKLRLQEFLELVRQVS